MDRKDLVVWIVCLLILATGLTWWIMSARPSETAIVEATRTLEPLPAADTLVSPTLREALAKRDPHGSLPVNPIPATPPRTDPFQP